MSHTSSLLSTLSLLVAAACSTPGEAPPPATAVTVLERPLPATRAGGGVAIDASLRQRMQLLFARALEDDQAIATLAELLRAAPKRLSGSPGAADAVAWAQSKMQALGLQHVRSEPCLVPCWVRGTETARVVSPRELPLRITALGGSIATPKEGLSAEVLEVRSFEQLQQLGEQARGKIVFFNRPMPRVLRRTGMAYGEAVPQRANGAIEAGKVGAVAALVRSVTTVIDEFPHTGAMQYDAAVPKVPAAAVCTADAEALARLLQQGPVRIELQLGCETRPDQPSGNVVGEIRGRLQPEEVVVIGAHLDAWDLGDGAQDDGAGCAHVLEAMRLLQVCGITPRRTIRAVLFMNEENGLRGAEAYALQHQGEKHAAALETDSGGFTPEGFTCSLQDEAAAALKPLFAPLQEYDAGAFVTGGGGGADIGPLGKQGVPLLGLVVVGHRYFDYHHSALDKLPAVNGRELALGAAAVAYAASVLADQ